jgi:RNA recognition motif-containing protein
MILNPINGSSLEKQFIRTALHHMNNKLFVGNLSFNTTENDLQDAFAAHGTVVEANLITDRTTGRARGFAFVTMSTDDEAQRAVAELDGKSIDGRPLKVSVARPREERSSDRSQQYSGSRSRN